MSSGEPMADHTAGQREPSAPSRGSLSSQRRLTIALDYDVEAHFSYDEPKAEYAKRNGIAVDVWIDDSPGWIVGIT